MLFVEQIFYIFSSFVITDFGTTYFRRFGNILMIEIKVGGFAFVEFEDYRDARKAVRELDGTR
jgi:hypothetical protein